MNKSTATWLTILLIPFFFSFCQADDQTEQLEKRVVAGPSLSELLEFAQRTNPTIQAARAAWMAGLERSQTATGLPDPQLMATYFTTPIETRLGPQDWNLTLSQTIPFPTKLANLGTMLATDATLARLQLDKAHGEIGTAIRHSFHELVYIGRAKAVAVQIRELLDHLRLVAETAMAQDQATLVDVMKAQSQVAQLRYDALLLEELEQTEKAQLNGLLNRLPAAPLGPLRPAVAPPLTVGLDEIFQLATANRDEVRMAANRVQRARANRNLAAAQRLPDLKLGLFYAGIGEPDTPTPPLDAGRDAVGIQAGISIPLWFGKNNHLVREAEAEIRRAQALQAAQVNDTRTAVQRVYFRLQNAQRLTVLYQEELLPQAARAMELAETWFREGRGSFSDFVETATVWYNFQLSMARAQADYGKELARLEQLAGATLTGKPSEIIPATNRGEEP